MSWLTAPSRVSADPPIARQPALPLHYLGPGRGRAGHPPGLDGLRAKPARSINLRRGSNALKGTARSGRSKGGKRVPGRSSKKAPGRPLGGRAPALYNQLGPCSLSPVYRSPGTGQDSSGRRKQDTCRPTCEAAGAWQERPAYEAGPEGIEVGSRSAGESEQDPNPITLCLPVAFETREPARKSD